jgi:CRP/FNR family cyclic AMP-dependent transcriptional regulator
MHATRTAPLPLASPSVGRTASMLMRVPGAHVRQVRAGRVVSRNESERFLSLVLSGGVGLWTTGPTARWGLLAVVGPGETFGGFCETASCESPSSGCSEARTIVPTGLMDVPLAELRAAASGDRDLAGLILDLAATRVRMLEGRLASTLTQRVPQRLATILSELADRFGRPGSGGVRIDVPLPQEALAAMVGATRESVNRALASLQADGVICRAGRGYVLSCAPSPASAASRHDM